MSQKILGGTITDLQQKILQQHPSWPQEKARWVTLQALNIINLTGRRK